MSSNRFVPGSATIAFDPSGAFLPRGLSRDEWVALYPRLETARENVAGGNAGNYSATILSITEQMLADYQAARRRSELGRILGAAKRLREAVDRAVIVGSASDLAAARALFAAGCHPYHNEQGRGDRGGRPRIYFAGEQFDNDQLAGLLDHLPHERPAATVDDRWAIVAIDSNATGTTAAPGVQSPTHSAAVAFRILLRALRRSCGDDSDRLARLVLPIVNEQSGLALVGQTLDFTERFDIPPGVAGPAAVFTAAGLLPASVMGLDIVRLLQGAAAMNERFGLAPIGDNPPLDFAGILKLMRRRVSKAAVRFATFSRGGRAVGKFCETLANGDNLRSEISDSRFQNVDLQSAAPPLRVQLIVESVRRDRIAIHPDDASANPLARSIPDLNAAAIEARKAALAAAGQSSVEIKLASLDEFSLGQLFQMLIIARVLESRL